MGLPGDADTLELTVNIGRDEPYDLGDGYNHIALTVDDLDALLARAVEDRRRAREAAVRARAAAPEIGRICFVQDPDGYRIELIDGGEFRRRTPTRTYARPDGAYRPRGPARRRAHALRAAGLPVAWPPRGQPRTVFFGRAVRSRGTGRAAPACAEYRAKRTRRRDHLWPCRPRRHRRARSSPPRARRRLASARRRGRQTRPAAPPTPEHATRVDAARALKQQVGKLVVLRFQGTDGARATCATVLRNGWASGAILFGDNITSPAAAASAHGGAARPAREPRRDADRLHRPGGRRDPQRRVGAARAPRRPRQVPGRDAQGRGAGAAARAGINVTLAPVARRPVGRRRRAGRARVLARSRSASRRRRRPRSTGWRAGGVAADGQALPRPRRRDRQHRPAARPRSRRRAHRRRPRARSRPRSRPRCRSIMSSHARLPAAGSATRSPSQSRPILEDLLRDQLRLQGRRDHGHDRGRRRPRHRQYGADRGALDPRRQRHRAHHRPGLVDPRLPGAARRGRALDGRSARASRRPPRGCWRSNDPR